MEVPESQKKNSFKGGKDGLMESLNPIKVRDRERESESRPVARAREEQGGAERERDIEKARGREATNTTIIFESTQTESLHHEFENFRLFSRPNSYTDGTRTRSLE
eukprot:1035611-Rhodomonas_salina.5